MKLLQFVLCTWAMTYYYLSFILSNYYLYDIVNMENDMIIIMSDSIYMYIYIYIHNN